VQNSGVLTRSGGQSTWAPAVAGCTAQFVILVNVTTVTVALAAIRADLGLSVSELQWVAAIYPLAYGLVVVPAGRLGDIIGRRPMIWIGLGTFVFGCVVGGVAWDSWSIILARVLQGLAAGILNPQVLGMLNDSYRGERRATAFGMFGATVGIATAAGPALGGLIMEFPGHSSWHLLFWINVPLALLLLVVTSRISFARPPRRRLDLDLVGLLLLGLAVVGLLIPIVGMAPGLGWTVAAVGGSLIAVLAAVVWERHYAARGRAPLLDQAMFKQAAFRNGVLVGGAHLAALSAFDIALALYLQDTLGMRPLYVGLLLAPFALGSAASAVLGRRQVLHSGRTVVVRGSVVAIVGWTLCGVSAGTTSGATFLVTVTLAQVIAGVGAGLVLSPNQNLTLGAVDEKHIGTAGGLLQVLQRLGSALGTSIGTAAFFSNTSVRASNQALIMPIGVAVAFAVVVLAISSYDAYRRPGASQSSVIDSPGGRSPAVPSYET
jgi:MFS family permease